jgi:hypothetical protein
LEVSLSDIASIFNDHAEGLGLHRLNGQEVAELKALAPKDERQADLFFHDVASDLDRMCVRWFAPNGSRAGWGAGLPHSDKEGR